MADTHTEETDEWAAALGRTIKVRRTDLGISRKQLAEASDISYSYLSAIENGAKVPSTNTLRVIARELGTESYVVQAEVEGRLARDMIRADADFSDQEQRFADRLDARVAARGFGASSVGDRQALASFITSLDDEDIATLTRVAEGLALRRKDVTAR